MFKTIEFPSLPAFDKVQLGAIIDINKRFHDKGEKRVRYILHRFQAPPGYTVPAPIPDQSKLTGNVCNLLDPVELLLDLLD